MTVKLRRGDREQLFSAEMKLARVHSHICNRIDNSLPEAEREGLRMALAMAWALYRVVREMQGAVQ